jgi:hypothetical protein
MEQGLPLAVAVGVDRYLDTHFDHCDDREPVRICSMMRAHGWRIIDTPAIAPDLAYGVYTPALSYQRLYRFPRAAYHARRAATAWVLAMTLLGRGPVLRVPLWTQAIPMGDSDPEVAGVARHLLIPDRLLFQCASIAEIAALCDVPPLMASGRVRCLPYLQQQQFMSHDEWLAVDLDRQPSHS